MKTAILLKLFRKPEFIISQLDIIQKAQPKYLFIFSDAARINENIESQKVDELRSLIDHYPFSGIKVNKWYADHNFGMENLYKVNDWFFSENRAGLLLEDDLFPDLSYFEFIDQILEKYKSEDQVKVISGSNFLGNYMSDTTHSYVFSKIPSFWGWATWRSFWESINLDLAKTLSETEFNDIFDQKFANKRDRFYFKSLYGMQRYKGFRLGGDQKVMFNMWYQNGLSIVPTVNLVENKGIGHRFAYSQNVVKFQKLADLTTGSIKDVVHPQRIVRDDKFDRQLMDQIFNPPQPLTTRIKNKITRLFN